MASAGTVTIDVKVKHQRRWKHRWARRLAVAVDVLAVAYFMVIGFAAIFAGYHPTHQSVGVAFIWLAGLIIEIEMPRDRA
jgi:hypothetical protein